MTVDESKALKKGTRVYWRGNAADSGIFVTEVFPRDKDMNSTKSAARPWLLGCAVFTLALAPLGVAAQTSEPIKIGVISEAQAVAGSSIPLAAQLAADEINAAGGLDGRQIKIFPYDNHSSATESVRAFQRAVNEDHVNAVIASYVSEVVLALEPWTGGNDMRSGYHKAEPSLHLLDPHWKSSMEVVDPKQRGAEHLLDCAIKRAQPRPHRPA
jgi:hypothetical protein